MILIDTPVWSLVLRRKAEHLSARELRIKEAWREIVDDGRAQMLGPIREELLSGLREESQFRRLQNYLRDFPDAPIITEDYEDAARAGNLCRSAGIATSPVDMLICTVARRYDWEILTTDQHFSHCNRILHLRLLAIS